MNDFTERSSECEHANCKCWLDCDDQIAINFKKAMFFHPGWYRTVANATLQQEVISFVRCCTDGIVACTHKLEHPVWWT